MRYLYCRKNKISKISASTNSSQCALVPNPKLMWYQRNAASYHSVPYTGRMKQFARSQPSLFWSYLGLYWSDFLQIETTWTDMRYLLCRKKKVPKISASTNRSQCALVPNPKLMWYQRNAVCFHSVMWYQRRAARFHWVPYTGRMK